MLREVYHLPLTSPMVHPGSKSRARRGNKEFYNLNSAAESELCKYFHTHLFCFPVSEFYQAERALSELGMR